MSNATQTCPQCGTALPADAPAGLCPQCLMALNLGPETVLTEDATAPRAALPPEQIAPHFPQLEILECLGRGGMGVVYKARQKSLNRLVALKLLAPERVRDPQFAGRFAREAQALAALSHPNIVTIHDFGQAGGFYYLLMELVDGANLRQLLRARKFTPEEALAMVPPLCDALQYAHDRGIVHRDIKPENLLLDKSGRLKVADFGIAKMLGSLPAAEPDSLAAATDATQSALGTPGYRAPEQKSDPGRVDSRADIYSLGVVIYELLTGELPGGRLEPPSRKVRIDVRLDEVVLRALEQKPELRYQQASQVKTMVETIVATPVGEAAAANPGGAEAKGDVVNGEPGTLVRLLGWTILDPLPPRILKGVRLVGCILLAIGAALAVWNPWQIEGKWGLFICLVFFGPLILLTFFAEWGIQKGRETVAPPNPEQLRLTRIIRWARRLQTIALLALLVYAFFTGKRVSPEWFFLLVLFPLGVELFLYRHVGYRSPPTLPDPNDLAFKLGRKLGWYVASSNASKRPAQPGWQVDYKTKAHIGGWPWVHVAYGQDTATGKMRVARGVIAIGNMAQGVVAIGSIAMGAFAFGGLAFGGFAYGGLALGLLAVGGGAGGLIAAAGGWAIAPIALGGMAIGVMAFGGKGVGMYVSDALTQDATAQNFFMPWAKQLMANFQAINFLLVAFVLALGLGLPWWLSRRKVEVPPPDGTGRRPLTPLSLWIVGLLFVFQGLGSLWDTYVQMGPLNFWFEASVFCLPIGVGLWRLRGFWRKSAVLACWLQLGLCGAAMIAISITSRLSTSPSDFSHKLRSLTVSETQAQAWLPLMVICVAALAVWMIRVLTRPHIKALFQSPPPRRVAWLETGLTVAVACLPLLNVWNYAAMRLGVEYPESSFGQRLSRLMGQNQAGGRMQSINLRSQLSRPFIAQLDHCTVELVAISHPPLTNTACWLPNGELSPEPFPEKEGSSDNYNNSPQERIVAFRVTNVGTNGMSQPIVRVQNAPGLVPQAITWQPPHAAAPVGIFFQNFASPDATKPLSPTVDISIGIANGAWETALSEGHRQATNAKRTRSDPNTGNWMLSFQANPMRNGDMGVTCTYSKKPDWETRMVVVDAQGETTVLTENTTNSGEEQSTAFLDVSAEEFANIKEFRLERRPRQWAQFRQVSLAPGTLTVVDIVSTKLENAQPVNPPSAIIQPSPNTIAEIEPEVANVGRNNGEGATAANQPSVKAAPVKPNSFEVEASPTAPLKYNWRVKPEAISPDLVAEPPQLRFWAWQGEWRTNFLGSAHYPDGSSVANAEDLALLQQMPPPYYKAPTPFRRLHLWFSHPLFAASPGSDLTLALIGPEGELTPLEAVHECSTLAPSANTGELGWCFSTFRCKEMTIPYGPSTLRLTYTLGPFAEKKTSDAQMASFDLFPDGAYGTGLGQDESGVACVTVMVKPENLKTKQYDVLANLIRGEEEKGSIIGRMWGPELNGMVGLKFAFHAPLKDIASITIGSRPIRSQTYSVVFGGPGPASEGGLGQEIPSEAREQAAAKAFLASRMKLDFSVPVDREQLKVVAEDLAVAERQLEVGVVSPLDYAMIKLTNEVMLAQAKGQYNEAAQLWLVTKARELMALKNKSQTGVIPPDEYECARLDFESARAEAGGQDGLAAWYQFRRTSLELDTAKRRTAAGIDTLASESRAKIALKRAAAVPALLAEPPQLCFVAWQEQWQKNQSVAARHADGAAIKTDEERDWLKNLNPPGMDVSKLNLTPQPRLAHLWIAHPLFDDSSVIGLETVDANGQVIPDGAQGHQAGSCSKPDRANGFCGWAVRTFAPGETRPLNLRLRYAVGPLERTNTLRVAESTSLNMTLEGDCGINGVGQNAEGQAFIALSYLPARLGARQYQAVAITKKGEELRARDTSLSALNGDGMCLAKFTFNLPLQKLEAFTLGTRPIRTQVWSNVVMP